MYDRFARPSQTLQDQQGVMSVTNQDTKYSMGRPRRSAARRAAEAVGFAGLCVLVSLSAIVVKEGAARKDLDALAGISTTQASSSSALAAVIETTKIDPNAEEPTGVADVLDPLVPQVEVAKPVAAAPMEPVQPVSTIQYAPSTDYRYFNGRPIRPARTMRMVVTAYSPDEKSCGPNARGITSSIHNVHTNAMKLVAADSRVLPLGSMISVPGYDDANVVPVLDRGGAIKGNRLDVLFPTDAAARKWGVRTLNVVVWEYADNLPAEDFRAVRDSRN
jgi:3D (Asp-Asp-Asp) domain-containing protein